jgi:PAS domain S-box-containing protein
MPPQSAIFWLLLSEDAAGIPYSGDRALDKMREVAVVPIFGSDDHQLGRGIVGGPLLQTRFLGQEAAEIALRILKGEAPGDINPPSVVLGAPMYDWRELRRWNIKETLLPAGSIVHFREPTVWDQYRWQIILVAMALLAQALAIAGLFYQRRLRGIADAGLKQAEARMGVVAASTDAGLWQHDLSTGHLWATEHCLSMFGLAAGSRLSPEAFLGAIHPDDRAIATAAMRSTPSMGETSRRRGEFRVEHPGGDVRWYLVTAHTDVDEQGAPIRVSGIFRDVTARRKAEEDAERLSERLEALQDEERQRIASELHDSTTQHLVAMTLNLTSLRSRVAAQDETLELLDEIDSSLEEAAKELRTFTYLLHPPRLESEGLRATLQRYVDGFGRRTELKTTLRASGGADQLPLPLGRSMLRIVQEALTNVHRHAAATRVYVSVRLIGKQVHLVIKDDGQGFKEASGRRDSHPPRVGVGIAGMTARMQQLGGKLDIRSGPKGTTVHAVVHLG